MNFKEDFEYYLQCKFEDLEIEAPHTIEEIVRHTDINYIIPLKSELFVSKSATNQYKKLLNKVYLSLRNAGHSDQDELGKLYEEISLTLNK